MFKLLVNYDRLERLSIFNVRSLITRACIEKNRLDLLLYCQEENNFFDHVDACDHFFNLKQSSSYNAALVDFIIDVLKSHRACLSYYTGSLSSFVGYGDQVIMHLDIYEHLLRRDMFVLDPSSQPLSVKAAFFFIVERRVDLMMYPYIRKLLQSLTAVHVSLDHKGVELGRTVNKVLVNALDEYDKQRKDAELLVTEVTGLPQNVVNFVILEYL